MNCLTQTIYFEWIRILYLVPITFTLCLKYHSPKNNYRKLSEHRKLLCSMRNKDVITTFFPNFSSASLNINYTGSINWIANFRYDVDKFSTKTTYRSKRGIVFLIMHPNLDLSRASQIMLESINGSIRLLLLLFFDQFVLTCQSK